MGIHDRSYYRADIAEATTTRPHSAVGTLIVITVTAWVTQLIFRDSDPAWGGAITRFLAATPRDLFEGVPEFWRILTANFAHDWKNPWHIFGNMLFLYFFGRELEHVLGRRGFYLFYLTSGTVAILAELIVQRLEGGQTTIVLGASGAVTAVVVFYTLLEPTRKILFFLFIPAPVWVLCAFFVLQDVLGATSSSSSGVAHYAHLVGALYGLLYWRFALRPGAWTRWARRLLPGAKAGGQEPTAVETAATTTGTPLRDDDPVTRRIDELLQKIHEHGMDGLCEEERQFLGANHAKYRRP